MASLIFNSALYDGAAGSIDFDADLFKVMLVTSAYSPDKDADTRRSDVTDEVIGTGYSTGGETVTVSVTNDTGNDRIDVSLGGASWALSTITARGAVYYKSNGGAASGDPLVAYIDFGGDISSTAGLFSLTASTLRLQN
jgi:hypothetical protein